MKRVQKCPETLAEWNTMATRKKCEDYNQSCTDSFKFMYHCVVNSYLNETIEVCAPSAFITGYCCEFNAIGAVIQRNYDADCSNFSSNPCTEPYFSYEGYKHPECYALVQRRGYQKTTVEPDTENKTSIENDGNDGNSDEEQTLILAIIIAWMCILAGALAIFLVLFRNRKGKECCCFSTEENSNFDSVTEHNDDVQICMLELLPSNVEENTVMTETVPSAEARKIKKKSLELKDSNIKKKIKGTQFRGRFCGDACKHTKRKEGQ
ncbi:uncharacterized protein LOC134277388 isoform X2 [Saccostrea cucullata]